ncbi:MAG: hypothetical protein U1A24_11630 [Cypionkella sp.]|uniref:hypothetical protein n=1 Tax=Cypionkella sp. TaxID=2811411 RepID=UPI002AB9F67C|nr:hypothetical protein [Cypionkella sp.]MDZ4311192.1 hypothetical protein [Cypionkella sp.]
MFFISVSEAFPRIAVAIFYCFLGYFLFTCFWEISNAQVRLASLAVSVGVPAWLPWIFQRFEWVNFGKLNEKIKRRAPNKSGEIYLYFVNTLLIIFGVASLVFASFLDWPIAVFGKHAVVATIFAFAVLVFEYSMAETMHRYKGN